MADIFGIVVGLALTVIAVLIALWFTGAWKPSLPSFLGAVNKGS